MSSLIEELQRDAINESVSVSELLRKALVVSRKLNIKEFADWADLELKGYPPSADVPDYRKPPGRIMAQNPFHGWIPVMMDEEIAETMSKRGTNQSIGELERLVHDNKNSVNSAFVSCIFLMKYRFRLHSMPILLFQ